MEKEPTRHEGVTENAELEQGSPEGSTSEASAAETEARYRQWLVESQDAKGSA
jgi:hypothetical protein